MAVTIDKDECIKCGICVGICPESALDLGSAGIEIQPDQCVGCEKCVDACPAGALML